MPIRRPSPPKRRSFCFGLGVVLLGSGGAAAQNLLLNPDLNTGATDWSLTAGAWDNQEDFDGCDAGAGGSGSLNADSIEAGGGEQAAVSPNICINVSAGETIYTEIAYISPEIADVFPVTYLLENCAGAPTILEGDGNFKPTETWVLQAESITLPANVASIRIQWAAIALAGSFSTWWDRAYVGRAERIFAEDFEARRPCRWGGVTGGDFTPPTTPGPVTSSSHGDGQPHPGPIQISWGASTDSGSGVAGYRAGVTVQQLPLDCSDLPPGLIPGTSAAANGPSGTYFVYICAEDFEGNLSGVVSGGPYVLQ